ncbi:MAG: glycosyl transferase family 4 [Pseudomonadales bacterium]
MVPQSALAVLFVGFVGAGLLGFFVLRMASALQLLAHPNERSSHSEATPSIGGIAIVLPVLLYLTSAAGAYPALWALVAAIALVALVGLWDDIRELPPQVRLGAQLLASLLALSLLFAQHSVWLWPVLLLLLMWHINLFNFMDGIDGLAASQALFFTMAALWLAPEMMAWLGYLLCVLAGTLVGFLVYNWTPARMFMGDVGSTFLGLLLALVGVLLWQSGNLAASASLILVSPFWFDASYTLCVRILTGQHFISAHRSHLYQRLSDQLGHGRTVAGFWLFALLWLLPLAALAQWQRGTLAGLLVGLAVAPLAWLVRRFKAGEVLADSEIVEKDQDH